MVATLIAETNRDPEKRRKPYTPDELGFPELRPPTSPEEQTANMKAKMRTLATMFRKKA